MLVDGRRKPKVPVSFERSLYLLHPYNATLVTCKGKGGKANVMAVAWITPASVEPPLVVMSIRPERFSYDLIAETKEFVVNIPTFKLAKKVLICGRQSGRTSDKFKKASLHPDRAKIVDAPIISECIAHVECRVVEMKSIGDHTLITGRVVAAYVSEGYFKDVYDVSRFQPCLHLGKNLFTTCMDESVEPRLQPGQ